MNNEEKIKAIIAEQLSVDLKYVVSAADWDSLGADSLDLVELIMTLEDAFDIEIASDVAEKITNVAEMVNLVNELTS